MPGDQVHGAGKGRKLLRLAGQPERGGETALPHRPAIKGRRAAAGPPAPFPTHGKCTSHLGFSLAVALLQKLLRGELATRRRTNVVQARSFAEMLEQTLRRYQNRAIEAAQVIEELIQLARDMRDAASRGERFGLTEDELAFYDALEANDSAVKVLGDETLRAIARELVETVRLNVTIDWTLRENVRAQLRVLVRRILRKHGYPPDKQEKATITVLEQAEALSEGWTR